MTNEIELTPDGFYDNCEQIFWIHDIEFKHFNSDKLKTFNSGKAFDYSEEEKLELLIDYLNAYFLYLNATFYQTDSSIGVMQNKDERILFNSFHDLEEFLKTRIAAKFKTNDEIKINQKLQLLLASLCGAVYWHIDLYEFVVENIREIYKQETKVILRKERVEALWEELIGKYGEDKIIEAEKFFQDPAINGLASSLFDDLSSGKEVMYLLMNNSDAVLNLKQLCVRKNINTYFTLISELWAGEFLKSFSEEDSKNLIKSYQYQWTLPDPIP